MAKEESPLFVGITEGDELRRSMLECSKDILESIKEHEKLKNVREEKMNLIHLLSNQELKICITRLAIKR